MASSEDKSTNKRERDSSSEYSPGKRISKSSPTTDPSLSSPTTKAYYSSSTIHPSSTTMGTNTVAGASGTATETVQETAQAQRQDIDMVEAEAVENEPQEAPAGLDNAFISFVGHLRSTISEDVMDPHLIMRVKWERFTRTDFFGIPAHILKDLVKEEHKILRSGLLPVKLVGRVVSVNALLTFNRRRYILQGLSMDSLKEREDFQDEDTVQIMSFRHNDMLYLGFYNASNPRPIDWGTRRPRTRCIVVGEVLADQ